MNNSPASVTAPNTAARVLVVGPFFGGGKGGRIRCCDIFGLGVVIFFFFFLVPERLVVLGMRGFRSFE